MRESIGGAWLFGIVIVFIFLFAAFLTYSISYTKAFNIKNEIINYIEENEGFTTINDTSVSPGNMSSSELNKSTEGKIYKLVYNVGYNIDATQDIVCKDNGTNFYGVCITKVCPNGDVNNTHYKVTSYIALEITVIDLSVNIPITGETRSIFTDNTGGIQCSSQIGG